MATKALLADLGDTLRRDRPLEMTFEAAGGLEVVRAIRAGARADLAVLAQEQMADLDAEGFFVADTLRPLFVSEVVAAVPEDVPLTALTTEADLRAALVGARRIAYSTGPSGGALLDLVQGWGLADSLRDRLVRAEPGTPVASLLIGGEADLGFQQRSELSDLAGVRVLGPLPGAAAVRTTFSGAVLATSADTAAARDALKFLASNEFDRRVRAGGMSRD